MIVELSKVELFSGGEIWWTEDREGNQVWHRSLVFDTAQGEVVLRLSGETSAALCMEVTEP